MPDIVRLPESWREQAAQLDKRAVTLPATPTRLEMIREAATLRSCAGDLEQAWHDHAHDGEWERGCTLCMAERAEQYQA